MKVIYAVIFALGFLALSGAHPAQPDRKEEVEIVPLEGQYYGRQPIVDTGVIGGSLPFDGLFESLSGVMTRMRQHMDQLLRRLPFGNRTGDSGSFPSPNFPGIPSLGNGAFPGIPNVDLSKGNSTSVTKIIDGHKVVINETEYKQEGDFGGAFFKVRVVDILPDSNEGTDKDAEEVTNKAESAESSYENEISKTREPEVSRNVEVFDEMDWAPPKIKNWGNFEKLESLEGNSIESEERPVDLSGDVYVNALMNDAGAPTDPDAEVFSNSEVRRAHHFEKIMDPR